MIATSNSFRNALYAAGAISLLLLPALGSPARSRETKKRPPFKQVSSIARASLSERDGYRPGDLINQTDVKRALKSLAVASWRPVDHKQILADALPESSDLVRILGTRQGIKFMRRVSDYEVIYDRMDRVSRVSGGKRMLTDIAKLPGGQKLAKLKRPHGVPGFLDLLPKKSSGKVRSIKNYTQPTGRIYTEQHLLERLKKSYEGK